MQRQDSTVGVGMVVVEPLTEVRCSHPQPDGGGVLDVRWVGTRGALLRGQLSTQQGPTGVRSGEQMEGSGGLQAGSTAPSSTKRR